MLSYCQKYASKKGEEMHRRMPTAIVRTMMYDATVSRPLAYLPQAFLQFLGVAKVALAKKNEVWARVSPGSYCTGWWQIILAPTRYPVGVISKA